MAEPKNTLAYVYKGWDRYQDLLVQTVAALTDEQLAWRAASNLRSAGELVAHIVGCRAGWFYYVMNEREEVLVEMSKWDEPGAAAPATSELVRGLQTTWQIIQNGLNRWTLADLDTEFKVKGEDDGVERTYTRQWLLWHLLEHDTHHGGEFSFVLGMHGREGMDI
jgi:uncharacterized damage-inducible protein DinB